MRTWSIAPGIVPRNNALDHCSSVHAPRGRLLQYFADGTTGTSRPDIVKLKVFHCTGLGYPELPGILRHADDDVDAAFQNSAQSSTREVVRGHISRLYSCWTDKGHYILIQCDTNHTPYFLPGAKLIKILVNPQPARLITLNIGDRIQWSKCDDCQRNEFEADLLLMLLSRVS